MRRMLSAPTGVALLAGVAALAQDGADTLAVLEVEQATSPEGTSATPTHPGCADCVPPPVATDQSQVASDLESALMDQVPILGRAYQSMLLLVPGVENQEGRGFFGSGNVTSHGARTDANRYLVDGGDTTDTALGTFGTTFNQDAISRIEVITASYPAQYGRSDGVMVNIITKSGGNDFEGSLRAEFRDSVLDKRGSGKRAYEGQDFRRRYYTATLGGPFIKDRLWFFTSLYAQDRDIVLLFPGDEYPVQHAPARFYDVFAKLTWQVTEMRQLVLSYHTDPATIHNAYAQGDYPLSYRSEQHQGGRFLSLRESATLGAAVILDSALFITDGQELDVRPERNAKPPCSGYNGHDDATGEYCGRNPHRYRSNRDRNELREDLTLPLQDSRGGKHVLGLGIDYALAFANEDYRVEDSYMLWNGIPQRKYYSATGPRFAPLLSSHTRNVALYAQDSWSPAPGLTLDIGVRADIQQMEFNGFTGSDLWYRDASFSQEDAKVTVDTIEHTGLAPRLGLAWDPRKHGKDVIRASAARYYTLLPGFVGGWEGESKLGGNLSCNTDLQGNCLDTATPELLLFYLDRDTRLPRTDELTLGYEREVISELAVGVTAIYRKGKDLLQDVDPNTYYRNVDRVGLGGTKMYMNPNFTSLYVLGNHDRSEYRGIELTANRRLSGNWQLLGSYTYSVAKGSGEWLATEESDDERRIPFEYSYLPYDQRHVLKLYGSYLLPGAVTLGAAARYATGTPYSMEVKNFVDLNGDGLPECDTSSWETCETRGSLTAGGTHAFGRKNSYRNDSYFNLDLRVEKDFAFRGVTLGGYGDVFNVFNDQAVIATDAWMDVYNTSCDPSWSSCAPYPGHVTKIEERRFGRQFQLGLVLHF